MENILAAVDFSSCSINALEHAVSIAQKGDLNLYMIWVNNPSVTKTTIHSSSSKELIEEVEKQFKHLIDKYKPILKNSKIDYLIREGKMYKEVIGTANELEAACIVLGTHGSSGFEQFWIGSNAMKVISLAQCPVITLRAGIAPTVDLKRIVMPIDGSLETRQKVPFTVYLAEIFDAEIYVLGVYTSKYKSMMRKVDDYVKQVVKYIENSDVSVHVESMKVDNTTTSIIDYAKKVDANLISIMTEKDTSPFNMLTGPQAQQMINHSPYPVLTVNSIELLRTGVRG